MKKTKKGQVGLILPLILAVGTGVLVLIFTSGISGVTFEILEPTLNEVGNNLVTNDNYGAYTFDGGTYSNSSVNVHLRNHNVQASTLVAHDTTNNTLFDATHFATAFTVTEIGSETYLTPKYGNFSGATIVYNYTWGSEDVRTQTTDAIIYGFTTNKMTAQYLQLIVLAVIIAVVIGLIVGISRPQGGNGSVW